MGEMVAAQRHVFDELYSIELDSDLYRAAVERFRNAPHIHILHGDSADVLSSLLTSLERPALFWLDAHYSGPGTAGAGADTPIAAEVSAVLSSVAMRHVILIDDARCFDGNRDYPSIHELQQLVQRKSPASTFDVEDDVIRICPPSLEARVISHRGMGA